MWLWQCGAVTLLMLLDGSIRPQCRCCFTLITVVSVRDEARVVVVWCIVPFARVSVCLNILT